MKVGVMVWIGESRATKRAPRYSEVRDMALLVEKLGFDSIWLADHLLYRMEGQPTIGIWECWTMLSALAEATQRVELGTLVLCNSFRNPAILAKMAITLDEVSQGRFTLGLGAGWNKPEYDAFGLPFDHLVSRFEEALQIIGPLVRQGRVDFEGKYYQACDCEITPRGPSPNGPPILIGAGEPRMLRLTAQHADLWNIAYTGQPHGFEPHRARMLEACAAVGRDPATLGMSALVGLAYPDLGEVPSGAFFGIEPLSGSDEEIAAAMRGYEEMGTAHLMFQMTPYIPESVERLGRALSLYRNNKSF